MLRSAVAAINKKGGREFGKGKEDFLGGCGERKEEGEVIYFYYKLKYREIIKSCKGSLLPHEKYQ